MGAARSTSALLEHVRASVIGHDAALAGPFGTRRITYLDTTASGRALAFIEDRIRDAVLPTYANTHTESSATGLQTTHLREEARALIARAVGAGEEHVVLFCGSGATGAIDRLVRVLGLSLPAELADRYALDAAIPAGERPVVLVGPYEHHSNELPWRESIAEVIAVGEDGDGRIDLASLAAALEATAGRPLRIGAFSAASNVTGIVSDVAAVSRMVHQHGGLVLWDCAAAGPHQSLSMTPPPEDPLACPDAVFLSPHKFVGGPQTPGVLVARRALFTNRVPAVPGGGTVRYVSAGHHDYIEDVATREEGGTPAIVESIRAGLVFALRDHVGVEVIHARERDFVQRALAAWDACPAIQVLGSRTAQRIAIVSFLVRHGEQRLHHNFVVALLNDLFGIQARGGCSCAGPYGHRLLGIGEEESRAFERAIMAGWEGIKPGWVRVSFPFYLSEAQFAFALDAVALVAEDGWRLLPAYRCDPRTGLWHHRDAAPAPPLTLADLGLDRPLPPVATEPESRLAEYLEEARALLLGAEDLADDRGAGGERSGGSVAALGALGEPEFPPDVEQLRWFPLPGEVAVPAR